MTHFLKILSITTAIVVLAGCGDSEAVKADKSSPQKKVTASSQLREFGPEGLLSATSPGWHSEEPPKYPESLTVDLQKPHKIKSLGFLHQDRHPERAPKAVRISTSNDGKSWTQVAESDNACANKPDEWFNIELPKPSTGRYIKVIISSNCGDPQFLTLRGLRIGK